MKENNILFTIDEMSQRMRRLETRLTNFIKYTGYPVRAAMGDEVRSRVLTGGEKGSLFVTGMDVTLGELMYAIDMYKVDTPWVKVYHGNFKIADLVNPTVTDH